MPTIRTASGAPATFTEARAVRTLDPSTKVRTTGITNFGAVADAQGQSPNVGMPSSITFTLDNSTGVATKGYRIGDADDWVVALAGFAGTAQPDRSSGISGANFAKAVAQAPLAVIGINYSATSGAVQFGEQFFFVQGEVNGSALKRPMNIAEYQRNTQFNDNLMTLRFDQPFRMDWNTGFYINAGIAQVVNVTLMFGAAGYR